MPTERKNALLHAPLLCLLGAAAAGPPQRASAAAGEPYRVQAIVGARVVVAPGKVLPRATIVVRDGIIEAIGPDVVPPPDARVRKGAGRTIWPGLIDAYVTESTLSGEKKKEGPAVPWWDRNEPVETPKTPGASHELPWVHPERDLAEDAKLDPPSVEKLRSLGFVAARIVPESGIFRGQAAVLALGEGTVNRLLVRGRAAAAVALEEQDGEYPSSLMGVIAAVRQTVEDARAYRDAGRAYALRPLGRERPESSRALDALGPAVAREVPVVLDALHDPLSVIRAGALARELGLDVQVIATGAEYKRIPEVKAAGLPLVLPLDFPGPPRIGEDADEWSLVPTEALRHWKRAPSNPRWLAEAGVRFAITTAKLKDVTVFPQRLRAAVEAGLDEKTALASLTTVPAALLGVSAELGTLERGKIASFVVADGSLFEEDTRLVEVWVDGTPYPVRKPAGTKKVADLAGPWSVTVDLPGGPAELVLEVQPKTAETKGRVVALSGPYAGRAVALRCAEMRERRFIASFDGAPLGAEGDVLLAADLDDRALTGFLETGDVSLPARGWKLTEPEARMAVQSGPPPAPEGGALEAPRALLVRNATVWTASADPGAPALLRGADLFAVGGRIVEIGWRLPAPPGALVIDGTGKHVTPGLIDAHSHTAISGDVNEGTRAVTAEVRIGDVLDSEDWNLYSELAGGLTVANLLHGSANPIGGQSQTIKLRWGLPPEALKLEGALPGIKFALGENVKQSNWGDRYTKRYPQTRMGVEQVMRERFLAARDYLRKWDDWREKSRTDAAAIRPRKDFQLETIAEILRGERLVHCHSYRQDEILMLLRLTEEFGIRIATLQHILEGYKVADEIAAHGAGASSFSDWWAYKFEVYDAIPWNGALMWDRGVVVSFNSDSNELARRLNTEATKAVKYGGLPEVEALKFVTLNPALQLRIAERVGSLEPGKDADFVVWSGPPLSTTSYAEETWIEGRKYFDRARDLERRKDEARERRSLVFEAKEAAETAGPDPGGTGYRPPWHTLAVHTADCMEEARGGERAAEGTER